MERQEWGVKKVGVTCRDIDTFKDKPLHKTLRYLHKQHTDVFNKSVGASDVYKIIDFCKKQ